MHFVEPVGLLGHEGVSCLEPGVVLEHLLFSQVWFRLGLVVLAEHLHWLPFEQLSLRFVLRIVLLNHFEGRHLSLIFS